MRKSIVDLIFLVFYSVLLCFVLEKGVYKVTPIFIPAFLWAGTHMVINIYEELMEFQND